jgi:hypothetical protein
MTKRLIKVSVFAVMILILGLGAIVWQNQNALAKDQAASVTVNAKANMAKYSPKSNNKSEKPIRRSRLSQMNVVSEAAQVLNVLPITIMDEMTKGKTLLQVAQDKGLTKAQFLQKLSDVENKTVDTATKAGTITQKHSDALKAGQKDRLTKSLDLKAVNVNDHQAMDMGN